MRHVILALAVLAFCAPTSVEAQESDQVVADQLANSLKASGQLSGYQIKVSYGSGVAMLEGWVADQQQMDAAVAVINQQPTVDSVVNKLKIEDTQPVIRSVQHQTPMPLARPVSHQQPVSFSALSRRQDAPAAAVPQPAVQGVPQGVPQGGYPGMYDQPYMPNYAWPSYAAYPNYAAVGYPKQYSPAAWPYIGPFYPYPQVPLGWRKVTLEWDDGWWFLDFSDQRHHGHAR
ncbi:MAG: BON domain-containing protein [Pirellulales bacterium]|nr:BON domain-containing protein [Pirellulales bacterium]